jgi:hypothetical protein
MRLITSILGLIFGTENQQAEIAGPEAGRTDTRSDDERFQYYNTFNLKDGHLLASELEKLELPFEVEFDDGIEPGVNRFGNGGNNAGMTLYIEETYRDILDDLVRLHFH